MSKARDSLWAEDLDSAVEAGGSKSSQILAALERVNIPTKALEPAELLLFSGPQMA